MVQKKEDGKRVGSEHWRPKQWQQIVLVRRDRSKMFQLACRFTGLCLAITYRIMNSPIKHTLASGTWNLGTATLQLNRNGFWSQEFVRRTTTFRSCLRLTSSYRRSGPLARWRKATKLLLHRLLLGPGRGGPVAGRANKNSP